MKHSIIDQLKIEVKSLFSGYPKFVYSKNSKTSLDGIPVFVYHTMEHELFESHLKYLKGNGYNTLSINDFYDKVTSKSGDNNSKDVLLTIDDARSSVWRYAYPLLKKYNMKATVFVIPGVTEEGNNVRLNLEDYWNGNCKLDDIDKIDQNDNSLCNWLEIKAMFDSGCVDIESHTLFHKEIFHAKRIEDYITPETEVLPYNFIGASYFDENNIGKEINLSDYYGMPLFESVPIMYGEKGFDVTPKFMTECKAIYGKSDANGYDWREKIKNLVNENIENPEYFKEITNGSELTKTDLKLARNEIKKRLGENTGDHLCLPWTKGNEKTVEICKELGVKSIFWGVLDQKKINKPGDNPHYISRIKNDFVFRLPGKGRASLISVYTYKLRRRISGEKVY